MIHINLQITNPWSDFFKTGLVWSGDITKHKFWELQAMRTSDVVVFRVEVTTRRDHAGLNVEIGLLSFNLAFNIYDNRHWDHSLTTWSNHD
jgi:hypothetical protein